MKKILLCITGSVAAVKNYEIIRKFQKENYEVQCVVSKGGEKFISRLALESLTGFQVLGPDIFSFQYSENPTEKIKKEIYAHIEASKNIEGIVIAPCSANSLSDIAHGKGDNFLLALLLANETPVLLAPAMNDRMWRNEAMQNNIKKMKKCNYFFVPPQTDEILACGDIGSGKMAETETIFLYYKKMICQKEKKNILKGKNILINAGGTKEFIDPVRYIGNESSGLTGKIFAEQSFILGAKTITVVTGNISVSYNDDISENFHFSSSAEIKKEMEKYFNNSDIIIFSAAISDYIPLKKSDEKIKKSSKNSLSLSFKENIDIASFFAQKKKKNQKFIGFALETETDEKKLENILKQKLEKKGFDIILGNSPKSFSSHQAEFLVYDRKNNEFLKKQGKKKNIFSELLMFQQAQQP